jgi:hypothetical protein
MAIDILSPFESAVFLWKHISVSNQFCKINRRFPFLLTGNERRTVQSASYILFTTYDIEGGGDGVEDGDGGGDENEMGSGDGERNTSRRWQPKIEEGRQEEIRIKDRYFPPIYWRNNPPCNNISL